MQLPSSINTARRSLPPKFGSAGAAPNLGAITGLASSTLNFVGGNRPRQMIVEDFVGFGLLRTWMDLMRGKEYGTDSYNFPAAGERLFRETTSILTDNMLGGLVALAIARGVYSRTMGAKFLNYPTVELFNTIAKGHVEDNLSGTDGQKAFIKSLAERLGGDASKQSTYQGILQEAWDAGVRQPEPKGWFGKAAAKVKPVTAQANFTEMAGRLATALKPGHNTFDWQVMTGDANALKPEKQWFKLKELLEDVSQFGRYMEKQVAGESGQAWKTLATDGLKQTLRAKNVMWPLGLGVGMLATFAMPFVNTAVTRKMYGINYYPGEIGLRKEEPLQQNLKNAKYQKQDDGQGAQSKSFMEKYFPYVSDSLKKGDWKPLIISLLPVPLALGFLDVEKLKWVNPFNKQVAKKLFDFSKSWPHTAPQQMAAMFAALITSRLLCARGDNEFRERLVDSFAGWGVWILGTPLIKLAYAHLSDKTGKTALLKPTDNSGWRKWTIREADEINHLLKETKGVAQTLSGKAITQDVIRATQKANVWIGLVSTVSSVFLLGIAEPWIGIKWTKANERQKRTKAAQEEQANRLAAVPLQRKPFYPGISPTTTQMAPASIPASPFLQPNPAAVGNFGITQPAVPLGKPQPPFQTAPLPWNQLQ